jgi:hypothetical protein
LDHSNFGINLLSADSFLPLGSEVVLDAESLAERFAFDHIRDGLATKIVEGLDSKEIGG